jgi:hypothetical protein
MTFAFLIQLLTVLTPYILLVVCGWAALLLGIRGIVKFVKPVLRS